MDIQITSEVFLQPIVHDPQYLETEVGAIRTDSCEYTDGVVPCIASIRQKIGDVRRLGELIQQSSSIGADAVSILLIQAVRFDNNCKLLFSLVAEGPQDVDNMFEDPGHWIWKDIITHGSLEKKMARYYDLSLISLEHCRQVWNEIQKTFELMKRQETMKYRYGRAVPEMLASDTAQEFFKLIQDLRSHIDMFSTFVRQVVIIPCNHLTGSLPANDLSHVNQLGGSEATGGDLRYIQSVSQLLYDTWSREWTCREHKAHDVNLSLHFLDAKASGTISCEGFSIAILVTIPHFDRYQGRNPLELRTQAKYSTSSGHDAETAACNAGRQKAGTHIYLDPIQDTVRDSRSEEDLCLYLRKACAAIGPTRNAERICIGYLTTKPGFHFEFFYEFRKQQLRSLDDFLSSKNNDSSTISVEGRLRLALSLGAGFLCLRASSWLRQAWSSKDIHFFHGDELNEEHTSAEIFLQTQLSSYNSQPSTSESGNSHAARSALLSLGLILIEIAFSAPWRKLQQRNDTIQTLSEREINFVHLMRLSEVVSRELGSRYAKVVRTCLSEGLGAENVRGRQANLDRFIYENIVKELDKCVSAVSDDSSKLGS